MSFIAITYGYNKYSIFNTNVSTFPLLDNIISTCVDNILQLLNSKLPIWDDQINKYNLEEDQIKKTIKKLESDILKDDEKLSENSKTKESQNQKEEDVKIDKKKGNSIAVNSKKYFIL